MVPEMMQSHLPTRSVYGPWFFWSELGSSLRGAPKGNSAFCVHRTEGTAEHPHLLDLGTRECSWRDSEEGGHLIKNETKSCFSKFINECNTFIFSHVHVPLSLKTVFSLHWFTFFFYSHVLPTFLFARSFNIFLMFIFKPLYNGPASRPPGGCLYWLMFSFDYMSLFLLHCASCNFLICARQCVWQCRDRSKYLLPGMDIPIFLSGL